LARYELPHTKEFAFGGPIDKGGVDFLLLHRWHGGVERACYCALSNTTSYFS